MVVDKILKEYFISQNSIKTAILYGSFASGNESDKSDVDIAIGGLEKFSPDILAILNLKISKLLNREVDLVDLNSISGTILTEVLTKGTVLKKEDTIFYAELIKKMLYFEEDIAPNIRYIMDYRREKFLNV